MRFKIFIFSLCICIGLVFAYSIWFIIPVVLAIYVVVAGIRDLWLSAFLRKWFYRLIQKPDLRRYYAQQGALYAYPMIMELELNPEYEKKFIEIGNDKFLDWIIEQTAKKCDSITNAMFGQVEEEPEEPLDPETQALMDEAMSPEYRDIVGEQETLDILKRHGIIAPTAAKGMELLQLRNHQEDSLDEQL